MGTGRTDKTDPHSSSRRSVFFAPLTRLQARAPTLDEKLHLCKSSWGLAASDNLAYAGATSPHLLQLFSEMLQHCSAVMLFVDYETFIKMRVSQQ